MAVRLARLGRQIVMQEDGGEPLVPPESIIRQAAQRCGVSYEEVMSRSRLAEIVDARHEAINALAILGYKPFQIAREMKLDHSTVSFHLGRIPGKAYRSCLA
jgi:chromosomal replication initiation ATPase DnaA